MTYNLKFEILYILFICECIYMFINYFQLFINNSIMLIMLY